MICPAVALGVTLPSDDAPSAPMRAAVYLIPATALAAGVLDWRWRFGQRGVWRIVRWFSPYEGATIVIFPIWACAVVSLSFSIVTLARHLHGP